MLFPGFFFALMMRFDLSAQVEQFPIRKSDPFEASLDGLVQEFLSDGSLRAYRGRFEGAVMAPVIHVPLLVFSNE